MSSHEQLIYIWTALQGASMVSIQANEKIPGFPVSRPYQAFRYTEVMHQS